MLKKRERERNVRAPSGWGTGDERRGGADPSPVPGVTDVSENL